MIERNKIITAEKTLLYYDECGNSEMPVLFIHGFPFDKSMWEPQMEFLMDKHHAIAPDLPGFGKSGKPEEKFSIALFAEMIIDFMDVIQVEKVILCGLSMGGYIALNMIQRFPERIAGLILCDTQCIADSEEAKEKRKSNIKLIEDGGISAYADGFIKNVFSAKTTENKSPVVEEIRDIILSTDPATMTASLKALAERWETCSSLEDISVPVLIVCGTDDSITPPAQSKSMHDRIRNSTLLLIEQAGHLSTLEQPAAFNSKLQQFLTDHFHQ